MTKNGQDPLLSAADNCADLVEPPTETELNHAITGNMGHLLVVVSTLSRGMPCRGLTKKQMKAVKRFKKLLIRKRPELMEGIFGRASRFVAPPHSLRTPRNTRESRSAENHDRIPLEQTLNAAGIHHDLDVSDDLVASPKAMERDPGPARSQEAVGERIFPVRSLTNGRRNQETECSSHHPELQRSQTLRDDHAKGHAHDPLTDTLFLDIGAGPASQTPPAGTNYVMSESPNGVDVNVYEEAYKQEMQKILEKRGESARLYPTRRVDHLKDIREHANVVTQASESVASSMKAGLAGLIAKAKENANKDDEENTREQSDEAASKES